MKRVVFVFFTILMSLLLLCPVSGEDTSDEEQIVLTIGDFKERSGHQYDEQLGMWQYLEDLLGVEIQYVYLTQEEYETGLVNGDLPDIVATQNNLSAILENGVALNADPYLEEYCPNFLKGDVRQCYDLFKQIMNEEDGFFFFPARIGYNGVGFDNVTSARGYVVRWDYYKELGYPPINNEDDYLNVLLQMYENHPFTEEGYPTYLYGTDKYNGYDTAFRAELNLDYWAAYQYQNDIFTNEVFDGYTDPSRSKLWTAMAWENKLYRAGTSKGAYDMELFTQSLTQFEAKCTRGQYLGLHAVKTWLYQDKILKDPDTLSGYAVVPTSTTNYYTNVYQILGNGSGYMWFISANSPHKEEALRLFNYMSDPDFLREFMLGRKGETWNYDSDGVPRMTEFGQEQLDAYMAGQASPDNYYTQWGSFSVLPTNWPVLRDTAVHPDGYPMDFATISREYAAATMTNNISLDICEHYGVELPTDAFYEAGGLDFRNDCGEAISSSISSLNREQLQILVDAEEIMAEVSVDLILAETDEKWNTIRDETIRKLTELGEPEVFIEYRRKWDAAAAVIVPLVRQAQIANGVEPYTPDEYADREAETEGDLP